MVTQLNQLLAIEKGVRARTADAFQEALQAIADPTRLAGISKTYQPKDEDGDVYPSQSTLVQVRAKDVIGGVRGALTRLIDVLASKDSTNCNARANIEVDGEVLAEDVSVDTLIFLEKQLGELGAFLSRLPVLDPAEKWEPDPTSEAWRSAEIRTAKMTTVPRNHVLAPATEHHPAQVQVYKEDVLVGYWTTVKFSGALPRAELTALLARVHKLAEAVKVAREKANSIPVVDRHIGADLLGWLLG